MPSQGKPRAGQPRFPRPRTGIIPGPSSLLVFCPDPTPPNQSPYDYTIFLDLCRGLGTVIGSPAPSRNCCKLKPLLGARCPAPIMSQERSPPPPLPRGAWSCLASISLSV
jgi:hypothetical protein